MVSDHPMVNLDAEQIQLNPAHFIRIPELATHLIFNPGPDDVVFVEAQTGYYLGEKDLECVEYYFGRV